MGQNKRLNNLFFLKELMKENKKVEKELLIAECSLRKGFARRTALELINTLVLTGYCSEIDEGPNKFIILND
jgi:hypothetical protein